MTAEPTCPACGEAIPEWGSHSCQQGERRVFVRWDVSLGGPGSTLEMVTDWKALLVKYVDHVGECEGSDFLSHTSEHLTMAEQHEIIAARQEAQS